jgi:hypothetical protein
VTGIGMGLMFSTCINTGTFGISPQDAGVASASVNTGQQLGGSIGTSLLNSIAVSAAASYIAANARTFHGPVLALQAAAALHSYTTVFWWGVGIFLSGTVICGTLMRRGPLYARHVSASPQAGSATAGAPDSVPVPPHLG